MIRTTYVTLHLCLLLVFALSAANAPAMPPSPDAIERWKAEGVLEEMLEAWRVVEERSGANEPRDLLLDLNKLRATQSQGVNAQETLQVCVILVDFFDNPATIGDSAKYDSLLFTEGISPTGSMTDFYLDNSYGAVYVTGEVHGWYRMPHSYAYYVGENHGDLAWKLAEDAVIAADDAGLNFRKFTGGVPGVYHGLTVVHAGSGAESSGEGIWSHMSAFSGSYQPDSVVIATYTMQPEWYGGLLSTIGVFCHEYGHILGLPDFYDVLRHQGSEGLGAWSLMAGGSWNGMLGNSPSHFDAYSKIKLGYVTPIPVYDTGTYSILQAEIPQVETDPVIYRLKNEGVTWAEYWLVENRQKVGFDAALPGEGLLIYHVDKQAPINTNPDRYGVAVEEADGNYSLAYGGERGERGDPWPGSTDNRNFCDFSWPNSKTNEDTVASEVGVWNISDSDSLMTADLEAKFTHPWPVWHSEDPRVFIDTMAGGNGDGFLDPGETIEFHAQLDNLMELTWDLSYRLSVNHPEVQFTQQEVYVKETFTPNFFDYPHRNSDPIIFTVPQGLEATNVVFTLTVLSDVSHSGVTEGDFVTQMGFEGVIGKPGVLVVDDDNGEEWQERYREALDRIGVAYGMWDKSISGSPGGADLMPYESVLWHTGHPTIGGTLTSSDVAALTEYLDSGGNLLLTSMTAAQTLSSIAPSFMSDYLHCTFESGDQFATAILGVAGDLVGDNTMYCYDGTQFQPNHDRLLPLDSGYGAFELNLGGFCGISFDGSYRSLFLTFPVEFIDDDLPGYEPKDTLLQRALSMFKGTPTDVGDDQSAETLPDDFVLRQNYPNPFNPTTEISYTIGVAPDRRKSRVSLDVFNVLGQKVRTLVDEDQPPGTYTVTWDGTADSGMAVASGVYLYRLLRGNEVQARKMLLVK
jgi:immune inhibitor A